MSDRSRSGDGRQQFRRVNRLLRAREFSAVFNFRCSERGRFYQAYARPNGMGIARLGLVVSSRVAGTAVLRNLHKRRIREAFRRHKTILAGTDVVVRLISLPAGEEQVLMRRELERVLLAVSRCLNKTGGRSGLSAHAEQS